MEAQFTLPVKRDICHAQADMCLSLRRKRQMVSSNHLARIRSIKISDTHDLLDIPSESGSYSKELENGIVLTLTIEEGKIVKNEAKDSKGHSLKISHLKNHSVTPAELGPVCFVCLSLTDPPNDYGDNMVCFRASCKLM
jgi:hypothetical protein